MAEGYKCFKKRDFGQFLYIAVGICLTALGILLLIQQDIGQPQIMLGLKVVTLISGLGIIAGYFMNLRTRFRPGWTLPTGIILTLAGGGYLIIDSVEALSKPFENVGDIILILSFVNSCLLLASAVQIFSLRLKRWYLYGVFSILSFVFFGFYFADAFTVRSGGYIGCAVFMFIMAAQLFTEGIIDLVKFAAARKDPVTGEKG